MLSRSAERLYWLGRYLERTENTARLLSVYMNLMFDLPMSVEISWRNLLTIFGATERFFQKHQSATEQNTLQFLLIDQEDAWSLFSSLSYARENIRTSRDLMPDEAWQQVNAMYLYIKDKGKTANSRRGRVILLNEILRGCQRFTGMLAGAMSQDDTYLFIKLGANIERADMTTRILDIGSILMAEDRSEKLRQYENTLWMNVLKSLSALLMYRKHRRHRINSGDVLDYLIKDPMFPRSINHCISQVAACFILLSRADSFSSDLSDLSNKLEKVDFFHISPMQLHEFLDHIQVILGATHNQVAATWFLASQTTC